MIKKSLIIKELYDRAVQPTRFKRYLLGRIETNTTTGDLTLTQPDSHINCSIKLERDKLVIYPDRAPFLRREFNHSTVSVADPDYHIQLQKAVKNFTKTAFYAKLLHITQLVMMANAMIGVFSLVFSFMNMKTAMDVSLSYVAVMNFLTLVPYTIFSSKQLKHIRIWRAIELS